MNAHNIDVYRGRTQIIHNISLSLPPAQLIALLGPNGAGKTTLLTTLAGLSMPSAGTITLNNTDITHMPIDERVTRGIVYLPQQSALFASMSIRQNIELVYNYHPYWQNKAHNQFTQEADQLLEQTNLISITQRTAGVLSGGQKRKLELVRALLMRPRILLCDEPFAGVDPKSITELTHLFTLLVTQYRMSVLLSDHNVAQLLAHADYVYLVLAGSIVARGTSEHIQNDPTTREQYLGDMFN